MRFVGKAILEDPSELRVSERYNDTRVFVAEVERIDHSGELWLPSEMSQRLVDVPALYQMAFTLQLVF